MKNYIKKIIPYIVIALISIFLVVTFFLYQKNQKTISKNNIQENTLEKNMELYGTFDDKYHYTVFLVRDGNICTPQKIEITPLLEEKNIIQIINLKDPESEDCDYSFGSKNYVEFGDYNFDGIGDFSIFNTMTGRNGEERNYYIFDKKEKIFELSERLSEMTQLEFNKENKIITSISVFGVNSIFNKLKFTENSLRLIESGANCQPDYIFDTNVIYDELEKPLQISIEVLSYDSQNLKTVTEGFLLIKNLKDFNIDLTRSGLFGTCTYEEEILENQIIKDKYKSIFENKMIYDDLVLFDINFDNRKDLLVKFDNGGNSGAFYKFYLNDGSGHFVETNLSGVFPSEFNKDEKIITQRAHASATSIYEIKSRYDIDSNKWIQLSSKNIQIQNKN
jgi:hypothetical protein